MIVKKEKLQEFLEKRKLTKSEFASKLGVDVSEVDKMLSGEPVGYETAKRFIYYMKAHRAQHYVDWKAIGVENPLNHDDYDEENKEVAK